MKAPQAPAGNAMHAHGRRHAPGRCDVQADSDEERLGRLFRAAFWTTGAVLALIGALLLLH